MAISRRNAEADIEPSGNASCAAISSRNGVVAVTVDVGMIALVAIVRIFVH